MERMMSSEQVMKKLVESWNEFYIGETYRYPGIIELCLGNERYFLEIEQRKLNLLSYAGQPIDLSVYCSFEDWVRLLSGRLHPWWGIISGRLRFVGRVIYLKQLPRVDFTAYYCDSEDAPDSFEKYPDRYWKIPERVLIVNASPRKEKGYTSLFSAYFRRGIKSVVAKTETLELEDFHLEACRGCWHCWLQSGGECIFDGRDDGRELLNRLEESDLVVFAFPLYSDGMPSGLKKLLDRRIATLKPQMVTGIGRTRHSRRIVKSQAIAVLSVCGFVEKRHFQVVQSHFRALAHNWHTPLVGELYRPGAIALFQHPLYYDLQRDVLAGVERAGRELALQGRISGRTRRKVEQDFLPAAGFRACANYFWAKNCQ